MKDKLDKVIKYLNSLNDNFLLLVGLLGCLVLSIISSILIIYEITNVVAITISVLIFIITWEIFYIFSLKYLKTREEWFALKGTAFMITVIFSFIFSLITGVIVIIIKEETKDFSFSKFVNGLKELFFNNYKTFIIVIVCIICVVLFFWLNYKLSTVITKKKEKKSRRKTK